VLGSTVFHKHCNQYKANGSSLKLGAMSRDDPTSPLTSTPLSLDPALASQSIRSRVLSQRCSKFCIGSKDPVAYRSAAGRVLSWENAWLPEAWRRFSSPSLQQEMLCLTVDELFRSPSYRDPKCVDASFHHVYCRAKTHCPRSVSWPSFWMCDVA
jgi:hypothetical protein